MKTKEPKTVNGRTLKPHDGGPEWSVCGKCGTQIDWANDVMFGPSAFASIEEWEKSRDDTTCPYCGHDDTAWLYAQEVNDDA